MIGIVVGLRAEARLARRLGGWVAVGGGSSQGARRAARELAAAGVTGLLSFGLAGGLAAGLAAGSLIVPDMVLAATGERWMTDFELSSRMGKPRGTVFAAAGAVASGAEKRAIGIHTDAVAVDLESGEVAAVAAEYRLPFAVLRAICDTAERDLPPAATAALDARGRVQLRILLRSIIASPGQLPDLFRLAREAAMARRALLARVRAIGSLD